MNAASWEEQVAGYVKILQVIVGALAAGCVFFLAIVLVVGPGAGNAADPRSLMLSCVAAAFLGAASGARSVVPGFLVRAGRKNIARGTFPAGQAAVQGESQQTPSPERDAVMLFTLFQAKTIAGAAILEGTTFFVLIAYMVERFAPLLAVAVVLILLIAAHMPTRSRVVGWIENQLRLVDEERSLDR